MHDRDSAYPWMLARMDTPNDEAHLRRLNTVIREVLFMECQDCFEIYEETGMVRVKCAICKAERSFEWIHKVESKARYNYTDPAQQAPLQRGLRG